LNSYSRLHSRRPYTLQLISATIIYLIGDLFAQSVAPTPPVEASTSSSDDAVKTTTYDPARTVRALVIGSTAAIPGYHWFLYLARNFNYKSKIISIVVKVLINQVVFTPIFNSYFFGMQSLLSGASAREIVERIKHTVPRSWVNSWKLWPVVTAFSFAFVRVELRGLFAGESLPPLSLGIPEKNVTDESSRGHCNRLASISLGLESTRSKDGAGKER
jgi:protein Mpv17